MRIYIYIYILCYTLFYYMEDKGDLGAPIKDDIGGYVEIVPWFVLRANPVHLEDCGLFSIILMHTYIYIYIYVYTYIHTHPLIRYIIPFQFSRFHLASKVFKCSGLGFGQGSGPNFTQKYIPTPSIQDESFGSILMDQCSSSNIY